MEVTAQLFGVGFFSFAFTWASGIKLQYSGSYSKCLCPSNHLAGPLPPLLIQLKWVSCLQAITEGMENPRTPCEKAHWTDQLISHPCALLTLDKSPWCYPVSWDPLLLYKSSPLFSLKLPPRVLNNTFLKPCSSVIYEFCSSNPANENPKPLTWWDLCMTVSFQHPRSWVKIHLSLGSLCWTQETPLFTTSVELIVCPRPGAVRSMSNGYIFYVQLGMGPQALCDKTLYIGIILKIGTFISWELIII